MVLDNINRWRQQLGLPPISSSQLSEEATQLQLAKAPQRTATMVNMAGNLSGGEGGAGQAAPFAGGAGRGGAGQAAPFAGGAAARSGRQPMPASGAAAEPAIEYDAPEGWQDGELVVSRGGIQIERAAAFEIVDGSQQAEVTVTSLPARSANIMNNVNRWRGQVQLEPWSERELQEETQPFSVGDVAGTYVELIGPEQAILGIIAVDNGTGWFIKLQGHHEVAVSEREHFKQFARSITFSGEQHE